MVELRKRRDPPTEVAKPPLKKSASSTTSKAKAGGAEESSSSANGATSAKKLIVGATIDLENFGGDIETNEGQKTTLKDLVDRSQSGVVIFTYPKASTPGCTTQACLFRDEYTPLTATGYSIFGLSNDSPKSNTTFKTKQNLPYVLLCDPAATLIGAIGMKKLPKGTTRGVVVIDKGGKIEAAEPGGPGATVDVVRRLVMGAKSKASENGGKGAEVGNVEETAEEKHSGSEPATAPDAETSDKAKADVAAEVADSAEKLDGNA